MRIDAQVSHDWNKINQGIKEKLECQSKVYLYPGLNFALYEICLGLHLKYSHKRKIVKEMGLGNHLRKIELEMAKLGVRFKDDFEDDMKKEEKACLAYVHDLDDALTGELFDHIETLKKIASTKMYRIHVAHHLFHTRRTFVQNLSEYDIIVASLDPGHALVFTGEKVSLPTLTVEQIPWNFDRDFKKVIQAIDRKSSLYQKEITEFEKTLPMGATPWFSKNMQKRIFDRSVVVINDADGSAFVDLLHNSLESKKKYPGEHQDFESTSFCRWHNDSWFKQAPDFDRSPEELRGLVAIDGRVLHAAFQECFNQCLKQIRSLSG